MLPSSSTVTPSVVDELGRQVEEAQHLAGPARLPAALALLAEDQQGVLVGAARERVRGRRAPGCRRDPRRRAARREQRRHVGRAAEGAKLIVRDFTCWPCTSAGDALLLDVDERSGRRVVAEALDADVARRLPSPSDGSSCTICIAVLASAAARGIGEDEGLPAAFFGDRRSCRCRSKVSPSVSRKLVICIWLMYSARVADLRDVAAFVPEDEEPAGGAVVRDGRTLPRRSRSACHLVAGRRADSSTGRGWPRRRAARPAASSAPRASRMCIGHSDQAVASARRRRSGGAQGAEAAQHQPRRRGERHRRQARRTDLVFAVDSLRRTPPIWLNTQRGCWWD